MTNFCRRDADSAVRRLDHFGRSVLELSEWEGVLFALFGPGVSTAGARLSGPSKGIGFLM